MTSSSAICASNENLFKASTEQEATSPSVEPGIARYLNSQQIARHNSQYFASYGTDLAFNNEFEKAIKYLSIAVLLNRNDHRLYFNRGFCYLELSRCEDALLDLDTAISLDSQWPKAYFKKGQVLSKMSCFEEAEKAYKKALSLDTSCKETHNQIRGNIYDALRHLGFDQIKAGYASEKYFSIQEAQNCLKAGAFEISLNWTRMAKKNRFKQLYEKKGILFPKNFY